MAQQPDFDSIKQMGVYEWQNIFVDPATILTEGDKIWCYSLPIRVGDETWKMTSLIQNSRIGRKETIMLI